MHKPQHIYKYINLEKKIRKAALYMEKTLEHKPQGLFFFIKFTFLFRLAATYRWDFKVITFCINWYLNRCSQIKDILKDEIMFLSLFNKKLLLKSLSLTFIPSKIVQNEHLSFEISIFTEGFRLNFEFELNH